MEPNIIINKRRKGFHYKAPIKIFLVGTLELLPNPFLSRFQVREEIYSILVGHTHYILIVKGRWMRGDYPFAWNNNILSIGETIQVEGHLIDFLDEKNNPYNVIEIIGLTSRQT